jgi:hypothetical protein
MRVEGAAALMQLALARWPASRALRPKPRAISNVPPEAFRSITPVISGSILSEVPYVFVFLLVHEYLSGRVGDFRRRFPVGAVTGLAVASTMNGRQLQRQIKGAGRFLRLYQKGIRKWKKPT